MPARPVAATLVALFCGGMALPPTLSAAESRSAARAPTDIELGRRLFERDWLADVPADSPLAAAPGGDGLGPLFNATSCVACHRLGGTGGAGPKANDVEMLSIFDPLIGSEAAKLAARGKAGRLHPALEVDGGAVMHRFGRDGSGSFERYDAFRRRLLSPFETARAGEGETRIRYVDGQRYELCRRNTPALFGLGVLDAVPPLLLIEVAALQKAEYPALAGQPSLDGSGRFGWRGQATSLEQFVEGACANELGLRIARNGRVVTHDQAAWPVDGPPTGPAPAQADLTPRQVRALARFVASLPAPRPERPQDAETRKAVAAGLGAFRALDCGVCHVQNLGPAESVFSDLLLHDMGDALADRVAAPKRISTVPTGYYGSSAADRYATLAWRTPPLWGVADSAPYLHDGRAATLDAAIRQHGGQAAPVAAAYAALPDSARGNLLAFLGTLRAPTLAGR